MKYFLSVLKNYAVFNGRASRSEFWYFFLISFLIWQLFGIIAGIQKTDQNEHQLVSNLSIITNIYLLAMLIPFISVGFRRMHDIGKSGWFLLIPIYNIILACTDGIIGANEYGPDPKTII